jgi:hypothetical protein
MAELMQPGSDRPEDELRRAWRAAILAYRCGFKETKSPLLAHKAAVSAFREILPDVPIEEASRQAMAAVGCAVATHSEWFWRGVFG